MCIRDVFGAFRNPKLKTRVSLFSSSTETSKKSLAKITIESASELSIVFVPKRRMATNASHLLQFLGQYIDDDHQV